MRGYRFASRIGLLRGCILNTFPPGAHRQGFTFFPSDHRQTPQQIDYVVAPQWTRSGSSAR
eukprot:14758006-Alexandrium_andersonii.AAC.1